MISEPDNFPNDDKRQDATTSETSEPESKSQRKRDAHQITELARQLVAMKPKALAALPLDPDIRDAITHCAEIRSHGARKRQLHFVSKLLRSSDNLDELKVKLAKPAMRKAGKAEAEMAQPGLADAKARPEQKNQPPINPHLAFRNQLLADFAGMVDALRKNYPDIELQRVRQLVRNAHNECKQVKTAATVTDGAGDITPDNTKAAKSLLKLLKASS